MKLELSLAIIPLCLTCVNMHIKCFLNLCSLQCQLTWCALKPPLFSDFIIHKLKSKLYERNKLKYFTSTITSRTILVNICIWMIRMFFEHQDNCTVCKPYQIREIFLKYMNEDICILELLSAGKDVLYVYIHFCN